MIDFNGDIPKGKPTLDPKYWENFKKNSDQNAILSDFNTANTKCSLKDLSIFKGGKK